MGVPDLRHLNIGIRTNRKDDHGYQCLFVRFVYDEIANEYVKELPRWFWYERWKSWKFNMKRQDEVIDHLKKTGARIWVDAVLHYGCRSYEGASSDSEVSICMLCFSMQDLHRH